MFEKLITDRWMGVFFAAGVMWCLSASPVVAETYIVKDGNAQAEIITADHPPRAVKLAASELQAYLRKISGAHVPITNVANSTVPVKLYVGKSRYTDGVKLSSDGLNYDAFQMISGAGWLALIGRDKDFVEPLTHTRNKNGRPFYFEEWDALTGGKWNNPIGWPGGSFNREVGISDFDERGSLNAVYEFLRLLGVRWYMAGDLGEIVPSKSTITLPEINRTVYPDFAYRNCGIYSPTFAKGSKEAVLWRLRIGLGKSPELMGVGEVAHGFPNVHSRDKSHPDYFALYNGVRQVDTAFGNGIPCFSSEGLFESTVNYCNAYFKAYPDEKIISLMPGDGLGNLCQCQLCKSKGTPERGYPGMMSDYVWGFVNRVATEVYKTYPDRKIINMAYGPYWLPPKNIVRFSPNVMVGFFNWRMGFGDEKRRTETVQTRNAYLAMVSPGYDFMVEHYLSSRPGIATEGVPVYFPHIISEDLASLKGKSAGEFIEVTYGYDSAGKDMFAPGFNHLNVYVTARCYWDAGLDVEALLNEYYRDFYGPAAKEMKAFIEYSEQNWVRMQSQVPVIDQAIEHLTAARKVAGDTVYGKRIDLIFAFIEPMKKNREVLAVGRKGVPRAEAMERKSVDIKLDGKLDKPFWNGVPEYELKDVVTGAPAPSKTTFKMVWSDMSLMIGIRCEEADMKGLNIATRANEEFNLWNGDAVELLLETQTHSYYQLAINPAGAMIDLDRKGGALNTLWNSEAEVAAYVGDTYWSLEVRIPVNDYDMGGADPLKKVEGKKPTALAPWYFNVCRQRIRAGMTGETDAFSPTGQKLYGVPLKFAELIAK